MTFLSQVTSGPTNAGQRIIIAGVEGIGKTTLACQAPQSLLIPFESGYGTIKSARLPNMITTWEQVKALCLELIAAAQAGKLARGSSLVWDTATALERITHDEVLRMDTDGQRKNGKNHNMATAHGGYGKAYLVARNLFAEWLGYIDQLALYGGIHSIVTCHTFAAKVIDPSAGEYDCYDLLLHTPKDQKNYGARELATQWADMIGFLHEPLIVVKQEGEKLSRGISENRGRMLAVERTPAFVAKNRYGVHGIVSIPEKDSWNYLADAIHKASGIDIFNRELMK